MDGNNDIRELCEMIENSIISMETVRKFYIGKTDNIERRREEHSVEDGYQLTKQIAEGTPEQINKAEKQAIAYFKKKGDERFENKGDGGEGPDGNLLYISLGLEITDINDLEDLDITIEPINL